MSSPSQCHGILYLCSAAHQHKMWHTTLLCADMRSSYASLHRDESITQRVLSADK